MESAQAVGSIIGVTVSATMLILIGGINLYSVLTMTLAFSPSDVIELLIHRPLFPMLLGRPHATRLVASE
jgi:hypothetical protein